MTSFPPKRKAQNSSKSTRKRAKLQATAAVDRLPWKSVSHHRTAGELDDDDGILELEEVDNVQVVYQETTEGRVAKFNVSGIVSQIYARNTR
jgi:ATP-dependent RNA helicase DDX24/MAK5